METLLPKSHAEEVALFRSEVVGALTRQQLEHGQLMAELRKLSHQRFRPPGADSTRTWSVTKVNTASGLDLLAECLRRGVAEGLVRRA